MKFSAFIFLALTVKVAEITCKKMNKKKEAPNESITELNNRVLRHILERLEKIENKVQANRDETKEVRNDVSDLKAILTEVLPGKSKRRPAESCSWIATHNYCVRSGQFWIKDGGKSSLQFCNMGDDIPTTTTVGTTATQSTKHPTTLHPRTDRPTTVHPTTVHPTSAHPTTQPIDYHGASCKELKNRYPHLKTGMYNITLEGSTFQVFCDMEIDQGGWTMVGNAVIHKDSEGEEIHYEHIQEDDLSELHKVTSGRFLLSTRGLNSLYDGQNFTEIRFQCFKPYHGRHLDFKTKGSEVLEWLLRRRSAEPEPRSCGSFIPLHNDHSFLGRHCERWSGGSWNFQHIYDIPMFGMSQDYCNGYAVSLHYYNDYRLYCDDYRYDHPGFSNVGNWTFYIR